MGPHKVVHVTLDRQAVLRGLGQNQLSDAVDRATRRTRWLHELPSESCRNLGLSHGRAQDLDPLLGPVFAARPPTRPRPAGSTFVALDSPEGNLV